MPEHSHLERVSPKDRSLLDKHLGYLSVSKLILQLKLLLQFSVLMFIGSVQMLWEKKSDLNIKLQGQEFSVYLWDFVMCLPYSRVVRNVAPSSVSPALCSGHVLRAESVSPALLPQFYSTPFLRTMDLVGSTVIIPWLVGSSEPEWLEQTACIMSIREKTSGSCTSVTLKVLTL